MGTASIFQALYATTNQPRQKQRYLLE